MLQGIATAFLRRTAFILVAFSVLNQSIDFDYIVAPTLSSRHITDFDDFDSITELLLESIAGDYSLTTEDFDDDAGNPMNKLTPQSSFTVLYCQAQPSLLPHSFKITPKQVFIDITSRKPTRGFLYIDTPPPDSIV